MANTGQAKPGQIKLGAFVHPAGHHVASWRLPEAPVVGRTEQEARDKFAALQEQIHPKVGLHFLSKLAGDIDLSGYPPDGPLPGIPETEGNKSRQSLIIARARREGLTIRQTYEAVAGARGHLQIVGTATRIAGELEAYFTEGGAGCSAMSMKAPHCANIPGFAVRRTSGTRRRREPPNNHANT